MYRAMLHMGSVARVAHGRASALKGVRSGAGQAPGFELEDLELVTTVRRVRCALVTQFVGIRFTWIVVRRR